MAGSCLIALGSNLGDRMIHLRRAVSAASDVIRVARISSVYESDPLDAPTGSPPFLNMVLIGTTALQPEDLLDALQSIERTLGRVRRKRNGPRTIDLDVILYGSVVARTPALTLPHPRYCDREFVLEPIRELGLGWVDPATGRPISRSRGGGSVERVGSLFAVSLADPIAPSSHSYPAVPSREGRAGTWSPRRRGSRSR